MEKNEEKIKKKSVEDIEVVIGDNSNLDISEVGDCMNNLKPKDLEKTKKTVIIPKNKKSKNKQ